MGSKSPIVQVLSSVMALVFILALPALSQTSTTTNAKPGMMMKMKHRMKAGDVKEDQRAVHQDEARIDKIMADIKVDQLNVTNHAGNPSALKKDNARLASDQKKLMKAQQRLAKDQAELQEDLAKTTNKQTPKSTTTKPGY